MSSTILSIDTSCDETSVAITDGRRVITNVIFSQTKLHAPFGGVYPTIAKREHLTKIHPAIQKALQQTKLSFKKLNAIAITYGPGLPPALDVGVHAAKNLALTYQLPLIPVDHIEGHIYAAFLQNSNGNPKRTITYPFLALVVSGGHTELVLVTHPLSYKIIGQTLDDAAGEALDKAARMLGLGYPGGPALEKIAEHGNKYAYTFPIPMKDVRSYDFSYSGLKTALKRQLQAMSEEDKIMHLSDLAASFQNTVIVSLLLKLKQALKEYPVQLVVLGGGVSANKTLTSEFRALVRNHNAQPLTPPFRYATGDNAAMIGIVAAEKMTAGIMLTTKKEIEALDRIPRTSLNKWVK